MCLSLDGDFGGGSGQDVEAAALHEKIGIVGVGEGGAVEGLSAFECDESVVGKEFELLAGFGVGGFAV